MANVTFNSIASSTSTAGNFKASEMWSSHATYTGNFNAVTDQVNNSNLDSVNYGVSGFQSSNIAHNAIQSQHISNNAVVSAKFGDGAIINNHMVYDISNSDGVRVLRCGTAGLKLCRISMTEAFAAAATDGDISSTITFIWSNSDHNVDGNPGFTVTPIPCAAPIARGNSPGTPKKWWNIVSINSVSVEFEYYFPAQDSTQTHTYWMQVAGF